MKGTSLSALISGLENKKSSARFGWLLLDGCIDYMKDVLIRWMYHETEGIL